MEEANLIQQNLDLRNIVLKLNDENTSLKKKIHELRIENARIIRDGVLKDSGLSQDTIKKLHLIFANSTDNAGLKTAIKVEQRSTK
jgi:hypothetical protein